MPRKRRTQPKRTTVSVPPSTLDLINTLKKKRRIGTTTQTIVNIVNDVASSEGLQPVLV